MAQDTNTDFLGRILAAYLDVGQLGDTMLVVRDDGWTNHVPLSRWHEARDVSAFEEQLLRNATPPLVLDIGCGTGRHLRWLSTHGYDAVGIDISEGAIRRARQFVGCRASVDSVWTHEANCKYNTIALMNSGLGIIGHSRRLYDFLCRMSLWLRPGGRLLVSGIDWRQPTDPIHIRYLTDNDRPYKGEVRLKLCYRDIQSDWFDWVWIDPDLLMNVAMSIGFHSFEHRQEGHRYATTLVWSNDRS
jgi:SAM-dependent methyltransferase